MAEIVIDGGFKNPLEALDLLPTPLVDGELVLFDPQALGLPPRPTPPTLKDTEISVTVKQTCPGYPACGRSTAACKVSSSSPGFDPVSYLDNYLPKIPIPIPPIPDITMPKIAIPIHIPSIGFPDFCPNSPKPPSAEEIAKAKTYANNNLPAAN